MKKLITILCILIMSASVAEARPHGWEHHHGRYWGPTYHYSHKHHHGGDVIAGIVAGAIGASIINYAIQPKTQITTTYNPISYAPVSYTPPTVVTTPVTTAPVVPTTVMNTTTISQPCYSTTNIVTGATTTHCNSTIVTNYPSTNLYFTN